MGVNSIFLLNKNLTVVSLWSMRKQNNVSGFFTALKVDEYLLSVNSYCLNINIKPHQFHLLVSKGFEVISYVELTHV